MPMADLDLEYPPGQTCPEDHGSTSRLSQCPTVELNKSTKSTENGQGTDIHTSSPVIAATDDS